MKAGERIEYTVTFLETTEPPTEPPPTLKGKYSVAHLALLHHRTPPASEFLFYYKAVGADYEWTDLLETPAEELEAFLHDPKVLLFTQRIDHWPGGFFLLDWREAGVCDLTYFGLMPDIVGKGFGQFFLDTALRKAWDDYVTNEKIERVTVNTCTLDHPGALPLYKRMGFRPIREETRHRILSRDRVGRPWRH